MPRSTKDSDDDYEPKTDRVRALAAQTAVNSPSLRRSSRIKQNRSSSVSPVSDTSSINSNQLTRVPRKRTTTMDSLDVPKEQRSRRISISSDISETMDVGTPSKRITRRSIAAMSSVTTPTKMNTRASNRRFVRAGSETKSPSPAVRITRKTRASSADPEPLPDESKSQPNTPIKVRRRASVLPANSPVKEEVEEHLIPYVRLDLTIFEEEPTNSANSNSSPEKLSHSQQSQKVSEKRKSVDKNKAEKENDEVTSSLVILDKTPEQLENNNETPNNSNSNSSILKTSNSSIGNLDCSLDKLKYFPENENANETRKSVNEVKENNDKATSSSIVSQSDEAVELPEKNKIFNKSNDNMNTITMDNKENLGDSNYLSDKVSQSQASQKISKRRKSGNKDNIEKDDNLGHEANRSENKSEMHNSSMDKLMHDKESLDEKQCNVTESPSSDDNTITGPTISSKVSMDTLGTTENDGNNDMKLMLEGQSPCHNANEVLSDVINLDSSAKLLVDMEVSSPINEKSNDQSIVKNKQSVKKNDASDNLELSKQESQKDISKRMKESESSSAIEPTPKPTSSGSDMIIMIQDNEPSNSADTSKEQILLSKLPEKEFIQRDTKQSNVDEASDDLENNSQLKKTEEDQETFPRRNVVDSDSESCINRLFLNVPANEQEKETTKGDDNADENSQECCSSQLMKKDQDNESEAECDLVLVDKQAWLAAENMKVARKEESSEYDSDDTVVKKSKLDAALANSSKILSIIDEEASTDMDVEKMDAFPTKKSHKKEKKSRKDKNSSIGKQYVEDTDNSNSTDESLDDSKVSSLDRNNDCSSSKLNKSEQAAKTVRRLSEIHSESDKEARDDADKLNKSSRTNKSLRRKSLQERKSLNESSKDTSLKQNDRNARNSFMDGDRTDKQEESDSIEISRKERRSLNKSYNKDNDTTEKKKSEKKRKSLSNKDDSKIEEETCLNRSTEKNLETIIKPLISINDDESSDSDSESIVLPAMDVGFDNYSTMAHVGSSVDDDSDDSEKINDTSDSSSSFLFAKSNYSTKARAGSNVDNDSDSEKINDTSDSSSKIMPNFLFVKANSDNDNDTDDTKDTEDTEDDTEDNSMNSDIRKEYNLDGAEQKFVDDNVPHDECRASESEYSDPNDNGSDLADFIVNDNEVEDEKEEEKDSDEEQEKNDEDEQEEIDDEDKQNEEEDNEIRKEKKKVNTKNKKRKTEKDYRQEEIEEYVMNENEDADDEQSEVEIDSNDGSNESNDEDESTKIIGGNEKSIEIISSRISETKKKQIAEETIVLDMSNSNMFNKSKKTRMAKTDETILISSDSPLYVKTKRKSLLRSSEKIETEQESPKQLEESTTKSRFSRKLSKLHAPMECSTPKLNSTKYKREFNIETPEALEKIQESKDNESETTQNTLPKKMKSKDSTMKRNISLTDVFQSDKCYVEKPLNTSLPSDLVKAIGKANLSKSTISKTMNVTHTETPTLRHLRKEKLNESAPVPKLHLKVDESKEKSSTTTEKDNVVTTEVKEKNDEEISNLEQSNNNTRKRKRQKKRKRQAEEMNKDITDKALSEDTTLESVLQDKKRIKLSESLTIENDICKDTPHINEKKKEKKKKKKEEIGVSEQYENVKEVDIYQNNRNETELVKHKKKKKKAKNSSNSESNASTNDICKDTPHINEEKKEKKKKKKKEQIDISEECENVKEADIQNDRNETKLVKHKKNKKVKIASNSEANAPMNDHTTVNKKFEQQEQQMAQSEEISPEKSTKKKKQEEASLSTKVSKTKSKNLESDKSRPQTIESNTIESRTAAFAKAKFEAREAIRAAEMRIRANRELKENKKWEQEKIQQLLRAQQIILKLKEQEAKKYSKKRKNEATEERNAFASSSEGTKVARLSDDVINNLEDIPTRAIKRRRLLQSEKSTTPPQPKTSRSKGSKGSKNASMKLSAFGGTTEFIITNLEKIQKQPPKQSSAAVSFRQRMLDRNKREPVSAYLMYLEKQRASKNNGSSNVS